MSVIRVRASGEYDVIVEPGLLERSGGLIKDLTPGGIAAVVTDDIVDNLYGGRLREALQSAGLSVCRFVIKSGEASKNAENYIALLNFLAENRLTRADTVVALGGGVVGDLAGFAAATYMRGIRFAQIPTTLLAAVDSSVGGKTAIDLPAGKNLAGAFYQPNIVLCDYLLLRTLPPDIYADGCAEIIKYGVIADAELVRCLSGDISGSIEEIITRCVTIKRDIVERDEFETGARKLLNFGHTVGHAIERQSGYGVPHGAAVAVGMAVITLASARRGLCDMECYNKIKRALRVCSLPYTTEFSAGELAGAALYDKKRGGDTLTLVVPEHIGSCRLLEMPVLELEDFYACGVRGAI